MSIIPIKRRHTNNRDNFVKFRQSQHSLLFSNCTETDIFELPVTIGKDYCDVFPATETSFLPIDDEGIRLAGRSALVVEVAELIEVPYNMFGIIFPKGTLATVHGVATTTTKVDPGFRGQLRLLVRNASAKSCHLKKGDVIASVVFFPTGLTVDEPVTGAKNDIVGRNPTTRYRVKKWLSANKDSVLIPLVASMLGALATLGAVFLM